MNWPRLRTFEVFRNSTCAAAEWKIVANTETAKASCKTVFLPESCAEKVLSQFTLWFKSRQVRRVFCNSLEDLTDCCQVQFISALVWLFVTSTLSLEFTIPTFAFSPERQRSALKITSMKICQFHTVQQMRVSFKVHKFVRLQVLTLNWTQYVHENSQVNICFLSDNYQAQSCFQRFTCSTVAYTMFRCYICVCVVLLSTNFLNVLQT